MSRIQPGSSDYFNARNKEIADIKAISPSKNWFVKKACKVMASLRKTFIGVTEVDKNYQANLQNTKTAIENDPYKTNIDNYVSQVVNDCKQEVFNSFKAGLFGLMAVVDQNENFVADLGNHPELNKALNSIRGKIRAQACDALGKLPELLNQIDTSDANTPFLQFVQALKDQLQEGAAAKIYLDKNLGNIKKAMVWNQNTDNVDKLSNLLGDDQKKNVLLLWSILEWQNALKKQRDELIEAFPTVPKIEKDNLKKYGYFTDQINAVKKVSERQAKEVSDRKKLEASLIGFLTAKVKKNVSDAERDIVNAKAPLYYAKAKVEQSETEISKLKKKLSSMRWHNEEAYPNYKANEDNLKGLKEDKKVQKELHKTFKKDWKKASHSLQTEMEKESDAVKHLKGNAKVQISELIDLIKASHALRDEAWALKQIYQVKEEWNLLCYVANTLPRMDDKLNEAERKALVERYGKVEAKVKAMQIDMKAIPEKYRDGLHVNFKGEKDSINYEAANQILLEFLKDLMTPPLTPQALPPVQKQPIEEKTNEVAVPVMKKEEPVIPPPIRNKRFSWTKVWERFTRPFQNLVNSTTIETSTVSSFSVVEPLKRFDLLDFWPGAAAPQKPPVMSEPPQKPLGVELNDLAKTLSKKRKSQLKLKEPKGQRNITGANCYMNSGLQNLEAFYLQYDKNCQDLILKDLTKGQNESFKDLEKRMHSWSPIIDPKDIDVKKIDDAIAQLQNVLSDLTKDQVNEKIRVNGKIKALQEQKNQIAMPEILFEGGVAVKWSYLLLLQAKAFGSNDDIVNALTVHHRAIFALDNPILPQNQMFRQLDSTDYLTLLNRVLGFSYNQLSYKSADANGVPYISTDTTFDPTSVITMNVRYDSGDGIVGNSKSLKQCLDRYFHSQVKFSVRETQLRSDLNQLRSEIEAKPDDEKLLGSIKKKEMDLLKITGGEFTRQNGTLATMAAADWKPEAGLSFKDWNDNRLITDKPKDLIQLSLNRFFTDETGGNQSKIADAISLDLDEENKPAGSFTAPLDLSKYFAPEALEGRSAEYELIGIAVHQGSTIHSGHYVAYIKKGNQWYHISDSSSSKINESAVPFTQASVLTYHRL